MLTKNEVNTLNLSPTKKDFAQIWTELLDVAKRLSERWDPTSTNESDPGIVILKALAGIADKLNYNIDKNILEAFMPTAAQEESMRKLCEMLSYSPKYYQSATTSVVITWNNTDPSEEEIKALRDGLLEIPKFTVLKNDDQDVYYFTINTGNVRITSAQPKTNPIPCMEGQIVKCESISGDYVITANQISENNRFYLPETNIAENGIFIYNIFTAKSSDDNIQLFDGEMWEKVTNLNTQARKTKVFKFGFDSYLERPYVEFPDDYSELIKDGLFIYYTRTNGVNGNISAHTLTQIELPTTEPWDKVNAESFSVDNIFAATSGANIETIDQAYKNFKKTVGTFDTLVTCRDYMNKIYSMIDPITGKEYVSNALVTDIRDDINRAVTICSCDSAGIYYKERPLVTYNKIEINKPICKELGPETWTWYVGDIKITDAIQLGLDSNSGFNVNESGEVSKDVSNNCWQITQGGNIFTTKLIAEKQVQSEQALIDHFDLVIYPYKNYTKIKNILSINDMNNFYNASFNYDEAAYRNITNAFRTEECSTIAHTFRAPNNNDISSINNYLRINAVIATNTKVSVDEGNEILLKIKMALANAFNMRELDFGEEIPLENIISVIENADPRIRIASLEEPAVYTTFSVINDQSTTNTIEYAVNSRWLTDEMANGKLGENNTRETAGISAFTYKSLKDNKYHNSFNVREAKEIYNKLVRRNILAGRVPLFNYDTTFSASFAESVYRVTQDSSEDAIKELPSLSGFRASSDHPYLVAISGDTIYTSRYISSGEVVSATNLNKNDSVDTNGNSGTTSSSPGTGNTGDNGADDESIPGGEASTGGNSNTENENDQSEPKPEAQIIYTQSVPLFGNNLIKDIAGVPQNSTLNTDINNVNNTDNNDDETDSIIDSNIIPITEGKTNPSDAKINSIEPFCNITLEDDCITDLTLEAGEFIRFRAPNFKTETTYPAYVNYCFELDESANLRAGKESQNAIATNLFDLLNNPEDRHWDLAYNSSFLEKYKKSFKISQTMSPISAADADSGNIESVGDLVIQIEGLEADENSVIDIHKILSTSGCIKFKKLQDDKFASVEWAPTAREKAPGDSDPETEKLNELKKIKFDLEDSQLYFTNENVVNTIKTNVSAALNTAAQSNLLPTSCSWKIFFTFEYIPFDNITLSAWEDFIRSTDFSTAFYPPAPNVEGTVLWRIVGDGYDKGKYVLDTSSKLGKFEKSKFGLLPDIALKGIFIAKSLGETAEKVIIPNDAEYELTKNDRLFIEYTPSSADEGTKLESPSVTKVYGAGTVIRPKGFANGGLLPSDQQQLAGVSASKAVDFSIDSNESPRTVGLYSIGANEQLEICNPAKVELSGGFNDSQLVYIYKNFNNSTLETITTANKGERSYTLKDNEYIFYTDRDKLALAYFTSGTEITLSDNCCLPKTTEYLDLSTILESGMDVIPWQRCVFPNDKAKITFQEYKFVTLGEGDTINSAMVLNSNNTSNNSGNNTIQSSTWYPCGNVKYTLADGTIKKLPSLNLADNGWEVTSILNLNTSPKKAQSTRAERGKIQTGIKLYSANNTGTGNNVVSLSAEGNSSHNIPMQIKTNLPCRTGNSMLNISNVQSNPNKADGFEFKIFQEKLPALVSTAHGKVVPININQDFDTWEGDVISQKDTQELWNHVDLSHITIEQDNSNGTQYDNALRLSICTLPKTYGVATFYVEFDSGSVPDSKVWIELMYGLSEHDIGFINKSTEDAWESGSAADFAPSKLYLSPGINCIYFNKSCDIFLKATKGALGRVFFDDLKLVACTELRYTTAKTDEEAVETVVRTQGLNLKQLDYFLLDENGLENSDIINSEAKDKLLRDKVESKKNELTKRVTDSSTVCIQAAKELKQYYQTVNALRTDFNVFEDNLANTDKRDSELELCELVNNLTDSIKNKLDILNSISSTETTVRDDLLELLKQFESKEITQKQMLEKIDSLIAQVSSNLSEQSSDALLKSFYILYNKYYGCDAAGSTPVVDIQEMLNTVISKAKAAVKQNKTSAFTQEISILLAGLGQISDNAIKTEVATTLNNLKDSINAEKRLEAQELIAKIQKKFDIQEIEQLLLSMTDCLTGNHESLGLPGLINCATQLKNIYTFSDAKNLLDQVAESVASNEAGQEPLNELIFKLQATLSSSSENESDNEEENEEDNIVKQLENLIVETQDLLGKSADDLKNANARLTLLEHVENLSKLIHKKNSEQITTAIELLDDIAQEIIIKPSDSDSTIKTLLVELDTLLTELKNDQNEQEEAAKENIILDVNKISDIIAEHKEFLANISEETFDINTLTGDLRSFFDQVVLEEWPTNVFNLVTNSICDPCRQLILAAQSDASIDNNLSAWIFDFPPELDVLISFEDIASLIITVQTSKSDQANDKETGIRSSVSTITTAVAELIPELDQNLIGTLGDTGLNKLAIKLVELIQQQDSVVEENITNTQQYKKVLLNLLKTELTNTIKIEEQLLNSAETVLYKNALQIKQKFKKDTYNYYLAETFCNSIVVSGVLEKSPNSSVNFENFVEITNFGSLFDVFDNINEANFLPETEGFPAWPKLESEYILVGALNNSIKSLVESFYDNRYTWELKKQVLTELINIKTIGDFINDNETEFGDELRKLQSELREINNKAISSSTDDLSILSLEAQLLSDLREADINNEFFYTIVPENSLAIELGHESTLATLMNPAAYYDINNINNKFVISKLDTEYLDTGLRIARSSLS